MFFESIASLWFALSLPAIIVMYLFKRKYIDTPVSSHMLWNRVLRDMEANRPWQKLRNRLLMILQLLVAALLVIALMKPFIWSEQTARDHVVIVMDNSASMQSRLNADEQTTRLASAKQMVLDWAADEARGSRFTLISIGTAPELLLSGNSSYDSLSDALDKVVPHYGRAAYDEAMSLAAALTRGDSQAEIRLFTDTQWLDSGSGIQVDVPLTIEQLGAGERGNVQVVQFGVRQSGTDSAAVTGVATLKNWGDTPAEFDLSVYASEQIAETSRETLQAEEQKTVYFQNLPASEVYRLEADVDDLLREDNIAYAFLAGDHSMKAVLISEGNLFLEKALALAGVEYMKVQKNGSDYALPASSFDLLIIDSVDETELSGEEWDRHLNNKPVWYIHSGMQGVETALPSAEYQVADHPVTRYIRLQDTYITSAWQGEPPSWAIPVVSSGALPLVYAGEENGHERLLFTFALHQSDLPLRFDFPILVRNAVDWLGSSRMSSLGSSLASDSKEIPLAAQTAKAYWERADGGDRIPAETKDGKVTSLQPIPPIPGLYQFVEEDEDGTVLQSRWLASMADARESNLAFRSEFAFGQTDGSAQPDQEDGSPATDQGLGEGRSPMAVTVWLIMLVLGLAVLEWGVYQRGNSV